MKRRRPQGSGVTKRPKKRLRAAQGTRQVKYVYRSPGVGISETKYFDAELAQSAITVSATTWANCEMDPAGLGTIFAPTTGSAYNQREGRKLWVKKIKINGWLIAPAVADLTASKQATTVRVILFMDKQTNGLQADAESLMGSGADTLPTICFQKPANFGRYRVLKDKTFQFSNANLSWDGTNMEMQGIVKMFKMKVNFKKKILVNYNNTNGGTIADIVDNSFHIIAVATGSSYDPELAYKVRTVYCE